MIFVDFIFPTVISKAVDDVAAGREEDHPIQIESTPEYEDDDQEEVDVAVHDYVINYINQSGLMAPASRWRDESKDVKNDIVLIPQKPRYLDSYLNIFLHFDFEVLNQNKFVIHVFIEGAVLVFMSHGLLCIRHLVTIYAISKTS